MKFNTHGVVEPGLHRYSLEKFKKEFIDSFPASQSRKCIFDEFIILLQKLTVNYQPTEIWLDGSYVTNKLNPNDLDLLVFLNVEDWIKFNEDNCIEKLRDNHLLDAYVAISSTNENLEKVSQDDSNVIINQRNYWRGQCGYDRNDNPKGIIVIENDMIEQYMKGGETNANII